jgi:hypothetical protein
MSDAYPAWAKPEAGVRQHGIVEPREHLQYGLLDQAIEHCRYAQHPHPFVARLTYFYLSQRARTIRSTEQFFPVAFPMLLAVGPKFIDGHPINACGTLITHNTIERLQHVAAALHLFHRHGD